MKVCIVGLGEVGLPTARYFRVRMKHYGTYHGKLLVGKEPSRVEFMKRKPS